MLSKISAKRFRLFYFIILLASSTGLFAQDLQDTIWIKKNTDLVQKLSIYTHGVNSSLIDALKKIPRHIFAAEAYLDIAYEDISLPGSGKGFTASPSDILKAIDLLSPSSSDKVLVAGNNTGYAAAVISKLAAEVYIIEETAAANDYAAKFSGIGINNVHFSQSADINEFKEIIAFDKIFICGAVPEISEKVTERLSIQGNLTFILAESGGFQQIVSMRRSLLGDSISCGGSCYYPEIGLLKITN